MASLSIITPTISRASLRATCESVQAGMGVYDEHIVVSDGVLQEWAGAYLATLPRTLVIETQHIGGYGNVQRDAGIATASGDYLLFVDDDDVFLPGAIDIMRSAVADNPGSMLLFRMEFNGYTVFPNGTLLPEFPAIVNGNVSTGMIACPRLRDMPLWAASGQLTYNCDFHFIQAMAERVPVVWRNEIVQTTRPHSMTH